MGYNKSLSAVYSDIWERYKHHCEGEGMIALNRFCEGEGINVQRLYEWLRRRKISISDYQDSLSGMPAGAGHHEEALFREVRLPRPSHARGDAEAAALYHSLAITCHRCGVNVFDYFCDRCAAWPPNTPIEKYRDLLPDRWKPSQK